MLTCYATFIVVICLNLLASVHLFTSDTLGRNDPTAGYCGISD